MPATPSPCKPRVRVWPASPKPMNTMRGSTANPLRKGIGNLWEDALRRLRVSHLATRVARGMHAALQGDARVVVPQMLLRGHALHRLALEVPDFIDRQQQLRHEMALLGLVRLEQEHGRRPDDLLLGPIPVRLRGNARLLRETGSIWVVAVVWILERMRQHE